MKENKGYVYSVKQVSELLEEPISTINYWMTYFDNILNLDGKNVAPKRYTTIDVDKLKVIKRLVREKDYCAKEVRKHFKTEYENLNNYNYENINYEKLARDLFAIYDVELRTQLTNLSNSFLKIIRDSYDAYNKELVNEIGEIIDIKLDEHFNKLHEYTNKQNDIALERLKLEQERNEQLEKIIIELINSTKSNVDYNNSKKNIFKIMK